ncbi:MAG: protein TolQ [Gammaproteobacteria bacterium]|nr:protein TolQ [Gammaproteobacteria bacterium]
MSADLAFFDLIIRASFTVQLVMLALLGASIISWTVIVHKYKLLHKAAVSADSFEEKFWSGIDLSELYASISKRRLARHGMEKVFESGFSEYAKLHKKAGSSEMILSGVQRSMKVALSREEDRLDQHLSLLATIGSISPYVGLFGTVWGIMNSFLALGAVKHATLAMVAPGIAEALIATAMGLFAAIPAVIAYNRYAEKVDRLCNRYENFQEEFSSLLHRQTINKTQVVEDKAV